MFGIFRRAAQREALKLQYQNHMASIFISAFDPALHREVTLLLDTVRAGWTPGGKMPPDMLEEMFKANKALRIAYDKTPPRHIRTFDQEFSPMLGWKTYYEDFVFL